MNRIQKVVSVKQENLSCMVDELSESLNEKIIELRKLIKEYKIDKKSKVEKFVSKIKKKRIKELKKSVRVDLRSWKSLSKMVVKLG